MELFCKTIERLLMLISYVIMQNLYVIYKDTKKANLTILTGQNCVLLSSVQEFIEIGAWLLLNFFVTQSNKS